MINQVVQVSFSALYTWIMTEKSPVVGENGRFPWATYQ